MNLIQYNRKGTIDSHIAGMTSLLANDGYVQKNDLSNSNQGVKQFQQKIFERKIGETLDSVIVLYTQNGKTGNTNCDSSMSIFGPKALHEYYFKKVLPNSGLIE
jgi:hypothetical protein